MTLPNERRNAVKNTRNFLRDLLDPKKTPKVPRSVRLQARYCLKHFPHDFELETPEVVSESMFGDTEHEQQQPVGHRYLDSAQEKPGRWDYPSPSKKKGKQ